MNSAPIKIFYGFAQADNQYKYTMDKYLTLLRQHNFIDEWCEREVIAGQDISERKRLALSESDIIIFLISIDFLSSKECKADWDAASKLALTDGKRIVTIIVAECPWKDFGGMGKLSPLPSNGVPIENWDTAESAWCDIYDGIKKVIGDIKSNFTIRNSFLNQISTMEFCSASSTPLCIEDIFVFPNIVKFTDFDDSDQHVKSVNDFKIHQNILIQGDFQSGKTTLANHLFIEFLKGSEPAILIDMQEISGKKPNLDLIKEIYQRELNGDFDLWLQKPNKIALIDNLTHAGNSIDHLEFMGNFFEKRIVMCSMEEYESYFSDDERLTGFSVFNLRPFNHAKQEKLIKKWLEYKNKGATTDIELGLIDQIENNVNSIIINNKILPRYPFFILSILQTHEAFMPQDIKITAYGHCYYALIMAHLIKSGISKDDSSISSCFNYASNLAYEIYSSDPISLTISREKYELFKNKYKDSYIIQDALINRMHSSNGIIRECNGHGYKFGLAYSYYYFLGQYLAENHNRNRNVLVEMIENNFRKNNSLAIIFTIHHSNDIDIIDEILTHTMCAHDEVDPATLDAKELEIFNELLSVIPDRLNVSGTIEETRSKERDGRDERDTKKVSGDIVIEQESEKNDHLDRTYQCYKNIEILSQILKNKFGSLKKDKVTEIVEIICDAGLRLAAMLLSKNINVDSLLQFVYRSYKESEDFDDSKSESEHLTEIRKMIIFRVFIWVVLNLEKTVSAINKTEIKEVVRAIKDKKKTPAFDVIYYFYTLDSSIRFEDYMKDELRELLEKYESKEMDFLRKILSIRTQHYMNTHDVKTQMRQAMSSLLKIEYKPKPLKIG